MESILSNKKGDVQKRALSQIKLWNKERACIPTFVDDCWCGGTHMHF